MAFRINPLSLCLPQATFEAWLRESGHLEILDKCALDEALLAGNGSFLAVIKALRINPFRSLTKEDLAKGPVSWTGQFFDCGLGPSETYSIPHSVTQAKLRMEENAKRYTGNYLVLSLIIFLSYLYKKPIAVVGILTIVLLWDTLRVCANQWRLDDDSLWYRAMHVLCDIATVYLSVVCKVGRCLFWAVMASLLVVLLHSALRRITPSQPPQKQNESRR